MVTQYTSCFVKNLNIDKIIIKNAVLKTFAVAWVKVM